MARETLAVDVYLKRHDRPHRDTTEQEDEPEAIEIMGYLAWLHTNGKVVVCTPYGKKRYLSTAAAEAKLPGFIKREERWER